MVIGRHILLLAVVAAALLITGWLLGRYVLFIPEQQGILAPGPTAGDIASGAIVSSALAEATVAEAASSLRLTVDEAGTLERLNGEQWERLDRGRLLEASDRVRTLEAGRVVLSADDGTSVELIDEVDVSVAVLTRSLAELELRSGRVRAELGDGSSLSVRVRSSDVIAEGRRGAFTVYADGMGMVAVASETAEVRLQAGGREVGVDGGEQSVVLAGGTPSDPERIPEEVFLRVAWPEERLRRERRIVVRGRVEAGSEVRVAGLVSEVSSDGTFEAEVELDAGPSTVEVTARDPSGRLRSERSPTIVVRNRPPRLEVVNEGIWRE